MAMNSKTLKVLVVDDTIMYRKIVSDTLSELPGVEVVGTANNGKIAISKIASLKPDILSLDIEMPEMNGLEVLAWIKEKNPDVGAVMFSTLTHQGADMTMKALELGAFDYIPKPDSGTIEENKKAIKDSLSLILKAFSRRKEIKQILNRKNVLAVPGEKPKTVPIQQSDKKRLSIPRVRKKNFSELIAIGISTGGPKALARMLPGIDDNLNVPILIVQHMPPVFTKSLANSLNSKCKIQVKEAVDGEPLSINTALIAPGGKQMKIAASPDGKNRIIRITDDPPENSCKPSVDYLFRSVAQYYIGRSTGVIMTGMGSDGFKGLKLMKQNGATVIAQDEATCIVYGMPKEPVRQGIVDIVAPLDRIAKEINKTVKH